MSITRKELSRATVSDKGVVPLELAGHPTILVVDDEELIREVTTIMIEDYGGKALVASDGDEGVKIFSENADKIEVVFLDFSMPGLNGYQAYLEMKRIKPEVEVIIVSGLAITPEVDQLRRDGSIIFLSKPFHEAELIKSIRALQEKKGLANMASV